MAGSDVVVTAKVVVGSDVEVGKGADVVTVAVVAADVDVGAAIAIVEGFVAAV